MLENDGVSISAHRSRIGDSSSRDGFHRGADRGADPDPVPPGCGVVRVYEATKPIQEYAVHRPIQSSYVRRADGAGRQRDGSASSGGSPALSLERGDEIIQPRLALLQLGETRLRALRILLHAREVSRLECLELRETGGLLLLRRAVLDHTVLQADKLHPLRFGLCVELVEAVNETLVPQSQEMQVFVSSHELSDGLGREQDFRGVKRSSLVDLDEASLQNRALHACFPLRLLEIARSRFDFVGNGNELLIE